MKRIALASAAILIAIAFVTVFIGQPEHLKHHIIMSSVVSKPATLAGLTKAADVIAVVRPTGHDEVHWNSEANTGWKPIDERLAMIYNDQEVVVVELLRGKAADRITIRNIGGTVGDTKFEIEGLEALVPGVDYLVFLEIVETPTREGWEEATSFIEQDQGLFYAQSDGSFVSDWDISVALRDLRAQ